MGSPAKAFQPIHLRPTAPLAERVLLPGDPGRALALAQLLIEQPKMFNHHRGLWGYTGPACIDGEPLTIQSTGMGGPSAAIVLHELTEMGACRAIRVGTCGALHPELALGDLVVVREAIAADGASAALASLPPSGATPSEATPSGATLSKTTVAGAALDPRARTHAHESLLEALIATATAALDSSPDRRVHPGATIASTDLFYEPGSDRGARWREEGAIAIEMEASALFAVGERAGIEVGCLLAVSDVFDEGGRRTRIDDHALMEAAEAMGRAAVAALTA